MIWFQVFLERETMVKIFGRLIILVGIFALASSSIAQMSAAEPAMIQHCESLVSDFSFENTALTEVSVVAAEEGNPEYCLVMGAMNQRTSEVDGNDYAILFEMRLPTDWNGRFYYQGNGGTDGIVASAEGGRIGSAVTALQRGFAVISSDAGHTGRSTAFGMDPQARLDYGYQAVGTLTPMAKVLIETAYGKGPDYSYIGGSSNGGRHAMVAAYRYADHYDGFMALAPGFNLPRAAVAQLWAAQLWAEVATDLSLPVQENRRTVPDSGFNTAFTSAERAVVSDAILAQCDGLDGLDDGMVLDIFGCQDAFNPLEDVPICSAERDGSCLSSKQIDIMATVFAGASTSNGEHFYSSFVYDPGIRQQQWADWEFLYSVNDQRDAVAYAFIFSTPPTPLARDADTLDFALNLDIDEAVAAIFATDDVYTESSMEFMTPPNPSNLNSLRDNGGKLLVVHGASDSIFSMQDTVNWYGQLDYDNGGNAEEFARLFLVPGMGHSRGGPATDQFESLMTLVNWVENGEAPDYMIANVQGNNSYVTDQGWSPERSRPLCMYPMVAMYTGGDEESADSFSCERP